MTGNDDHTKKLLNTSNNRNNSLLIQRKETPKPTNTFHTRPIKEEMKKESRISKKINQPLPELAMILYIV